VPRIKPMIRLAHLWSAMLFGMVFVVLGMTGSAITWMHELDSMLNPGLLQVAPPPGLAAGAPFRIAPDQVQAALDKLARDPRYGKPAQLVLPERAGDVLVAWYRAAPSGAGSPFSLAVARQVMLDPATLAVTGERNWGQTGLSRPLLMPTLFHVHRYLVAGEVGKTIVAVSGLALLATAIGGIVLWWPKPNRSALWKAITVRHGGSWPRFHFSLHRAAGIFAAPVMLIQAFSGVYFNQPAWIVPVVGALAPVAPAGKLHNRSPAGAPPIAPAQAMKVAQARLPEARVSRLLLPSRPGAPYELRLRQPGEIRQGDGATRIGIDSGDGQLLRLQDPLKARGGDKLLSWLFPLHSGEAFGIASRIFISCFGIAPLVFFVTGLALWRKRRNKPAAPGRSAARHRPDEDARSA
jgi:uncharacterized iron-regulated membrane protein